MTPAIQIPHKLFSREQNTQPKRVLTTLNGAETLEGDLITASKTRKDERTFLWNFHMINSGLCLCSILYQNILCWTFWPEFFESLSTELRIFSPAAKFPSFIARQNKLKHGRALKQPDHKRKLQETQIVDHMWYQMVKPLASAVNILYQLGMKIKHSTTNCYNL